MINTIPPPLAGGDEVPHPFLSIREYGMSLSDREGKILSPPPIPSPIKSPSVAQRHPAIQILPPCGMMSLKDLKEHHYTKQGGTLGMKNMVVGMPHSGRGGKYF
jgi:hypothetical protein